MAIDLTLYQMATFAAIGALGGITRELAPTPPGKTGNIVYQNFPIRYFLLPEYQDMLAQML